MRKKGEGIVFAGVLLITPWIISLIIDLGKIDGAAEYGLARFIVEFIAGILLFKLWEIHLGENLPWNQISIYTIALLIISSVLLQNLDKYAFLSIPLCGVLIYSLSYQQGVLASLMQSRIAMFWGKVSYSLYMTHTLSLTVLGTIFPVKNYLEAILVVRLCVFSTDFPHLIFKVFVFNSKIHAFGGVFSSE